MKRSYHTLLALVGIPLLAVLAMPTPGAAQDWRPEWGDRSIAFAVPDGGGGKFGLWWHRADGRARALELGLSSGASLDVGGETDRYSVGTGATLGLAFKRYGEPVGPVSPHLYSALGIGGNWSNQGIDDPGVDAVSYWGAGAYARLGLGVDWFPLERMSIGGYTGGDLRYSYQHPPAGRGSGYPHRHTLSFGLFTSGLSIHFYF